MDWKQVIAELVALGVKQPQIADACGCSQAAISMLANGKIKDPRDSLGQALRQLLTSKREEAAAKKALAAAPAAGAVTERRDPDRVNEFPDLDRRAPVAG